MKTKLLVGIALILTIFLVGSIILFGLSQFPTFTYAYFGFVLLCFVLLAYSIRNVFVNKGDFAVLIFAIVFMALAVTLFAQSAKSYVDKNQQLTESNQAIISQIESLGKTNDYYVSYISYLNGEINFHQKNSITLQAQIDQIVQQNNQQQNNQVTQPIVQTPPTNEIEGNEEEEDD
jgi:hypothetical protein